MKRREPEGKPIDRLELECERGDALDNVIEADRYLRDWNDELLRRLRDIEENDYPEPEIPDGEGGMTTVTQVLRHGITEMQEIRDNQQAYIDWVDEIMPKILRQDEAIREYVKALRAGDIIETGITDFDAKARFEILAHVTDSEFEARRFLKVIATLSFEYYETVWQGHEERYITKFNLWSCFIPLIEEEKAKPVYEEVYSRHRGRRKTTKTRSR